MSAAVSLHIHSDIALIQLDIPPVNAMSCDVRAELMRHIRTLAQDARIKAVVVTGTGKMFSGGVDIREFGTEKWDRLHLGDVCDAFEAYPGLLVMGLNGTTLGGGLELALTADYRVAYASALVGLPEVRLGLIPGAGGTQRLPRRVDPKLALEMIVSGEPIAATLALERGLIDRILPSQSEFRAAVIQYTQELLHAGAPRRRCAERNTLSLSPETVAEARSRWAVDAPGGSARSRCIEAVQAACRLPLAEGLRLERRVFEGRLATAEHRALRHIFFAERAALKVPGIGPETPSRKVARVGIVGGGTMGTGIALSCLAAGLEVTLVEISPEALARGVDRITSSLQASVDRRRLTREAAEQQRAALHGSVSFQDLGNADLVIEAVYESYEIKERVFGELDRACRKGCILASNTSTLDLNRIAGCTSRPSDVVGLHFFSPANVMRLLEIVRARHTSVDVIRTCQELAKRMRKIPVVVGVGFGFVGNRMMEPYTREAQRLVLEGASPSQVDGVLTRFGMAMGPLAVLDIAGLDVTFRIRESRRAEIAADPSYARLADELYALGRFGQKSGRGYYRYAGRERSDDPEVVEIAESLARTLDIPRRSISNQEVLERCLYSLIDEGARVIEERIALRAGDCDVVYVHGYGFPAWRGGPMHHADEIGLARVVAGLEKYREALGNYGAMWFQRSQLLQRLAASGERLGTFATTGER
jgi:3-hydroxyacyl-CoA dehydrogenase